MPVAVVRDLPVVAVEGTEITVRRVRLGMTIEDLASEAQVTRDTVSDWEAGKRRPRDVTVAKVVRALDRLEEEAGFDAPQPQKPQAGQLIEIRAEGVFGIESIVVGGPVEDRDELVETIAKLIERVRRGQPGNGNDD